MTLEHPVLPLRQIINGDCLEVMKGWPNHSVDCIIADAPYGVDMDYGASYIDSFENWKTLMNSFIPEALRIGRCLLLSTSKLEGEVYLFNNFVPLWRVCWYKGAAQTRCSIGFKDWETIFVYGSPKKQTHDHFRVNANDVRLKIPDHPCPKPIEWAIWLINHFTNEGDLVLDPFLGSGTTALAAEKLRRRWIGIEINKDYCEIARKRLEPWMNQSRLDSGDLKPYVKFPDPTLEAVKA